MDGFIEIRIKETRAADTSAVIFALYAASTSTELTKAEIQDGIVMHTAIKVCRLYQNDHDEVWSTLAGLIKELEQLGVEFDITEDGVPITLEALQRMPEERAREKENFAMMTDLQSGDPCIETLCWFKTYYANDNTGFCGELEQLVQRKALRDPATVEWIKQELGMSRYAQALSTVRQTRVRKVILFFRSGCKKCRKFAGRLKSIKANLHPITVELLDADDLANVELIGQYGQVNLHPGVTVLGDENYVLANTNVVGHSEDDLVRMIERIG